ncbi:hypothetical protein CYMTET_53090, partial [Cymbomonas tetramitiformis]
QRLRELQLPCAWLLRGRTGKDTRHPIPCSTVTLIQHVMNTEDTTIINAAGRVSDADRQNCSKLCAVLVELFSTQRQAELLSSLEDLLPQLLQTQSAALIIALNEVTTVLAQESLLAAYGSLLPYLANTTPSVRQVVIQLLGRLKPHVLSSLQEEIVGLLRHGEPETKCTALQLMGTLEPATIAAHQAVIVQQLESSNPHVQMAAVDALRRTHYPDKGACEKIQLLLEDQCLAFCVREAVVAFLRQTVLSVEDCCVKGTKALAAMIQQQQCPVGDFQELHLVGRDLTSLLPTLGHLTHLNLYGNPLGSIPDELGALTTLEHLNLGHCQLQDIPASLAQLRRLSLLHLGCNKFASLPPELGDLFECALKSGSIFLGENIQLLSPPKELHHESAWKILLFLRNKQVGRDTKEDYRPQTPKFIMKRGVTVAFVRAFFAFLKTEGSVSDELTVHDAVHGLGAAYPYESVPQSSWCIRTLTQRSRTNLVDTICASSPGNLLHQLGVGSPFGQITHFVSHVWGRPLKSLLDALENMEKNQLHLTQGPSYFFIDIFAINQTIGTREQKDDLDNLEYVVKTSGHTVLCWEPWYDPDLLKRVWCLFEMLQTLLSGGHLSIALGDKALGECLAFVKDSLSGADIGRTGLAHLVENCIRHRVPVNITNAKATIPADRDRILNKIQSSLGADNMNSELEKLLHPLFQETVLMSMLQSNDVLMRKKGVREIGFKYYQKRELKRGWLMQLRALLCQESDSSTLREVCIFFKTATGDIPLELLPDIHTLDLSGSTFCPAAANTLSQHLVCFKSLNILNLRDNNIGPNGAKALAVALTPNAQGVFNKSINTLNLKGNNIGPEGAKALAVALTPDAEGVFNTSVNTLHLEGNNIGNEGAKALAVALTPNAEGVFNGSLNTLDVCHNTITGDAAQQLAEAVLKHPCIKEFNKIMMQDIKDDKVTELYLNDKGREVPGALVLSKLLAFNGSLNTLGLEQNEIGDEGAKALAVALTPNEEGVYNTSLNTITITKGADLPIGAFRRNELTELDLSGKDLRCADAIILGAALVFNTSLNALNLYYNDIGDEGAKALAVALSPNEKRVFNSSLNTLDVCHNTITGDAAQQLAEAVLKHPCIKEFNKIMMQDIKDDKVTELYLNNKRIEVPGALVLSKLLAFNGSLNTLELCGNGIEDEGAKVLAVALTPNAEGVFNGSLNTLNLRDNKIGPDGAKALAVALTPNAEGVFNTSLNTLDLRDNNIGPEGAKALAVALTPNAEGVFNTSLNTLNLHRNNIGSEGAKALAVALTPNAEGVFNGSLNTLDVCSNAIIGNAAQQLAEAVLKHPCIKEFSKIMMQDIKDDKVTKLDLRDAGIGVPGALVLSKLLVFNKSLNTLNLECNNIGPEGAEALAVALTPNEEGVFNRSLNTVYLMGNHIGNEGAKALAVALTPNAEGVFNTSLNTLDLIDNEIRDEGAKALAVALTPNAEGVFNTSLNTLCMGYNYMGDEGKAAVLEPSSSMHDGAAHPDMQARVEPKNSRARKSKPSKCMSGSSRSAPQQVCPFFGEEAPLMSLHDEPLPLQTELGPAPLRSAIQAVHALTWKLWKFAGAMVSVTGEGEEPDAHAVALWVPLLREALKLLECRDCGPQQKRSTCLLEAPGRFVRRLLRRREGSDVQLVFSH